MFDESRDTEGPEQPSKPVMPPRKTFKVMRWAPGSVEMETFTIDAHFMAPLDSGGMAFNVYDFETPQGVSTIRVIANYFDIEQLTLSGIVH